MTKASCMGRARDGKLRRAPDEHIDRPHNRATVWSVQRPCAADRAVNFSEYRRLGRAAVDRRRAGDLRGLDVHLRYRPLGPAPLDQVALRAAADLCVLAPRPPPLPRRQDAGPHGPGGDQFLGPPRARVPDLAGRNRDFLSVFPLDTGDGGRPDPRLEFRQQHPHRGDGRQPHVDGPGERAAEPVQGQRRLSRDAPHHAGQFLFVVPQHVRPAVRPLLHDPAPAVPDHRRQRRVRLGDEGADRAAGRHRRDGASTASISRRATSSACAASWSGPTC